jgi:hypothetical protein
LIPLSTSLVNMAYIVINFAGDVLLAQAVKSYLSYQDVVSSIHMIPEGDEISVSLEKKIKETGTG